MATRPDIVVFGDFGPDWQLVVEVKAYAGDHAATEQRLRQYLQGYNCPLGVLVTPEDIRIFRETYSMPGPESVERVAVHPLPAELRGYGADGVAFERAVQYWLERLATSGTTIVGDVDLAATLDEHVVPVLREGEIHAGRPRWNREAGAG